jgi:predicted PurR-regulated permease PerM
MSTNNNNVPAEIPLRGHAFSVAQEREWSKPPSSASALYWPGKVPVLLLGGIFFLLFLYAMYFARSFLLPIALALLLNILLMPVVRAFRRLRVPIPLGAAFVLFALMGISGFGVSQLSEPASRWMAKAPQSLREIEAKVAKFKKPVQELSQATAQVDKITSMEQGRYTQIVEMRRPGLGELMFVETQELLVGAGATLVFLYFLLASGDLFLHKLVKVLPRLADKKRAVEIIRQIEHDLFAYLSTVTVVNIGLGATIGFMMLLLGMPNALLWGVMAGLLNFIPYLGAVVGVIIVAMVALGTFTNISHILLIPATYFVLNVLEAYVITPMVLSRRLTLNPMAILLGVTFLGWLWGGLGALLAVPLLVSAKIICDHFTSLSYLGEFLNR